MAAAKDYPANDVLELEDGELIPFVDDVIVSVDIPGRRLDVVEFVAVVRAIGGDPVRLFRDFVTGKLPPKGRKNSPR